MLQTSHTAAFNLYHLAKNSQSQEVLYQEILREAPPGTPVTLQTLNKMSYLKAVVKETARLGTTIYALKCVKGHQISSSKQ